MSFQAYLDNIQAKTGRPAKDIAGEVRAQGLSKPAEIIAWLKARYGLGHGHAMAIVSLVRSEGQPARSAEDKVAVYFSGAKAKWRGAYDRLLAQVQGFGPDVAASHGTIPAAASGSSSLRAVPAAHRQGTPRSAAS